MVTIYIDNKPYEVKEGQNLLQACLSLGFDIPYFCWHPALHSVGACRQCAVKQFRDEKDTRGKIIMSCMTPAGDGTRISIDDPEVKQFRAAVIEWLMLNHPHDCPVCDEGGECHLQDMTVMTGHVYRKSRFSKRTYFNQYLGPFLNHEMNRCIQCYRCVRFYRGYAGGRDLEVFASHDHVYFGRHRDGILESEFSGNLIEICPTGVFTDKTLKKHYTRKWDLQTAPSICVHCGAGCNTIPGERYGTLRRILNRFNGSVNGYFLCDRGRFGYEFVNSEKRFRQPLLRSFNKPSGRDAAAQARPVPVKTAIQYLSPLFHFGAEVIGIGSPRASLEANFVLRTLVGPDRFFSGMPEKESRLVSLIIEIMTKGPARPASLRDVKEADSVFVLGEDVANTAPMLALALRQSVLNGPMENARRLTIPDWHEAAMRTAIQEEKGPLFIASHCGTRLGDAALETYCAAPDDLARLGFAIAHEIDPEAPGVSGMAEEVLALAKRIAVALRKAKRPLVVSGAGCGSDLVIKAAANVAWALCNNHDQARLSFAVPECNSMGLGLLGARSLGEAFGAVREGTVETAIVLENDLYRRAGVEEVKKFFERVKRVIAIDNIFNATAERADVVLPAAAFAEGDGTLVNNEGRCQRFFQVFVPGGEIKESWRWLRDILAAAGRPEAAGWKTLDDIIDALAGEMPLFEPMKRAAPPSEFRMSGLKIPRQPHRHSGRTAVSAHVDVHEPKTPDDPDAPLSFSMEGYGGMPPSPLIARFWAPQWNSVQAVNKFQQEVGGPLHGGDPGLRLIEPEEAGRVSYFSDIPGSFIPREGELLIVPLYHVFGSEELSMEAPGIADLAPKPYLAMNPSDAEHLMVKEGEVVELTLLGAAHRLPAKIKSSLPAGVGGLPSGLPGTPWISLPAWARVAGMKK